MSNHLVYLLVIQFQDKWCDLKAQAEALVLYANNIHGLLTCALRPSNVFGPGDTQLIPILVDLAKSGWTKVCISLPCCNTTYPCSDLLECILMSRM